LLGEAHNKLQSKLATFSARMMRKKEVCPSKRGRTLLGSHAPKRLPSVFCRKQVVEA